jgi:starch phosphorylase
MPVIKTLQIVPNLPDNLSNLMEIAKNVWWTWNPDAIFLFQDMDRDLWQRTGHNPVALLGAIEQPRIEKLANDEIFLARLDDVYKKFQQYLNSHTWYKKHCKRENVCRQAYFSAEFGLHESLPLYSGGLGILAGDHMKSASDLGLPLVGVGLLYKHGYFQQYLNPEGWQLETYPSNDFHNMAVNLIKDENGEPVTITVPLENHDVHVQIWAIDVGRIKIYMLDTDVPLNSAEDRQITAYLYGGGVENRLKQEIVLGIGGIRALHKLDVVPTVCHMNEGHSAFMSIERMAVLIRENGLDFEEALEAVRAASVFTTHTPVPAGIDRFPVEMIRRYFVDIANEIGIGMERFLDLGRIRPGDNSEDFCMAVLAIRTAARTNGVSKLHGEVSRKMWKDIWPRIPENETPITHVTNGIHTRGWLSGEMSRLYQRYLGRKWMDDPSDHSIWKRVENIPAFELWRTRERLRERLIAFARTRLKKQLKARGVPGYQLKQAEEVLDPETLTIGFARRFATYKRATLLFRDIDRLKKIVNNRERPVQFIFSGKAHPKDSLGKELIQAVVQAGNDPELRTRLVFLENYEIEVARYLVQGVDVWLNNPRRPNEASGTSGMKVPANGGLNLSILDGWWCEGFNGHNGWTIGSGEEYDDHEYQDEIESRLLYDIIENMVAPLFYTRSRHGIPEEWVQIIKNSIQSICPVFNTNRMVEEYCTHFYMPGSDRWHIFTADNWKELRNICRWKKHVQENWDEVRIIEVRLIDNHTPKVGDRVPLRVKVDLGRLQADEVRVDAYLGRLDDSGRIPEGYPLPLLPEEDPEGTVQTYRGEILCLSSGQIGFAVRCYPWKKELAHHFELGLLTWWEG